MDEIYEYEIDENEIDENENYDNVNYDPAAELMIAAETDPFAARYLADEFPHLSEP